MISTHRLLYAGQAIGLLLTFRGSAQLQAPVKLCEITLAEARQAAVVIFSGTCRS